MTAGMVWVACADMKIENTVVLLILRAFHTVTQWASVSTEAYAIDKVMGHVV